MAKLTNTKNSLREQRVRWLIQHPEEWQHLPPLKKPYSHYSEWRDWIHQHQKRLVKMMKEDGVVASTTYWLDVNVPGLIDSAQEILKGGLNYMGTKNNPGQFDCYTKALPDEPMFTLLGRDPMAPTLVEVWAQARKIAATKATDADKVEEAMRCASDMRAYLNRLGKEEEPFAMIATDRNDDRPLEDKIVEIVRAIKEGSHEPGGDHEVKVPLSVLRQLTAASGAAT